MARELTVADMAKHFYDKHKNVFNLVYPPRFHKGKNGEYHENMCYMPSCNEKYGEQDYEYWEGLFLNFNFRTCTINVYADSGSKIHDFYGLMHAKELFEKEIDSVFKQWLLECLEESKDMIYDFLKDEV